MVREAKLRRTFKKIKEELDDHLDSINQNTNEVQANYEYIQKLERKIDKLNEKLEELIMMVCTDDELEYVRDALREVQLSEKEKQVFLALYTSEDFLSYEEIATKTNMSTFLASRYCTNLLEKGVPIVKRFVEREPQIQLEPWFKELQAKENIMNIKQDKY